MTCPDSDLLIMLVAMIERIPGTFWGIVMGAVFTLIGVWGTNRGAFRRQQALLTQEASMKKLDREQTLRREIYLGAFESMAVGILSIRRFRDFDLPEKEVTTPYEEKAPALAKIDAVASEETLRKTMIFSTELGATFRRLAAKRRLLLTPSYGSSSNEEFLLEHKTFEQDCMAEILQLIELRARAIAAMRRDLGVPIDEATYMQIIKHGNQKTDAISRAAPGSAPQIKP